MALHLKCPKHPKYGGKTSPRCSCEPCQIIFSMRLNALRNHVEVIDSASKESTHDEGETKHGGNE